MVSEDFLIFEPGISPIHRANPVIKLAVLISLALLFSVAGFIVLVSAAVALPILVAVAGVPFKSAARGSLFVGVLVVSFCIFSLVDISINPFAVNFTFDRITTLLLYCSRIMVVYFYNALFYATTPLSDLRRSLASVENLICPKVPHSLRLSLVVTLFLKFIPLCIAEWHELDRAWVSRCGSKGIRKIVILLPKFITRMMGKAEDTALAMIGRALS